MSNKQQTAVEYFFSELQRMQYFIGNDMLQAYNQAKEMEKEQITEGFKKGLEYWNGDEWKLIDIEQYYKETYETSN